LKRRLNRQEAKEEREQRQQFHRGVPRDLREDWCLRKQVRIHLVTAGMKRLTDTKTKVGAGFRLVHLRVASFRPDSVEATTIGGLLFGGRRVWERYL
jgi:hypothetical protein